jgi:hypothetical protein
MEKGKKCEVAEFQEIANNVAANIEIMVDPSPLLLPPLPFPSPLSLPPLSPEYFS